MSTEGQAPTKPSVDLVDELTVSTLHAPLGATASSCRKAEAGTRAPGKRDPVICRGPGSSPRGDDAGAFDAQVLIGTPYDANPQSREKNQTRCVHVRELMTP